MSDIFDVAMKIPFPLPLSVRMSLQFVNEREENVSDPSLSCVEPALM